MQLSESSVQPTLLWNKNILPMGWMGREYQPVPVWAHRTGPLVSFPQRLELSGPIWVGKDWEVHPQNISPNPRRAHTTLKPHICDHTDIDWNNKHSCETRCGLQTQRNDSTPRAQLHYPTTIIYFNSLPILSIETLSITVISNYS